jgi:hypothetical protein
MVAPDGLDADVLFDPASAAMRSAAIKLTANKARRDLDVPRESRILQVMWVPLKFSLN